MAKLTLDDIQKAIDAINQKITNGQGKITASATDYLKNFKSIKDAAASLEVTMKGILQTQIAMDTGLEDIRDRFNDIGKELKGQKSSYDNMYKSFSKLVNLADDLSDIQYDLAESSLKETKALKNKVNLEFNRLKNNAKYLEQQIKDGKFKDKALDKARELLEFARDEAKAFEEKVGHQDDFNSAIDETYKRQKRVHNALGVTGKLISGLGGLLEKVGFEDFSEEIEQAKEKMGALAIEITNNGKKAAGFGGTMKVGLTGLKSLGKSILSSLTDPLVVITIITKAIKGLIDLSNEYGKNVAKVSTNFGIAGKEAEKVYNTINQVSSMYYFPEELLEGQIAYNEALGMNLKFNQENAEIMQDLTTRLGYSNDAAAKLMQLSAATGENYYDISKNTASTVTSFNKQNKTGISLKKVMETIAGASSSTRFNIKGGVKGLAESAALAAKYGMSMDEVAQSAKTLLNFEDSISNELEAELLTGKDLNLERLRYASLTGDTNTQLKEQERLVRQNFKRLKGNVIAQEAFAKSIGMSVEDVAKMAEQQDRIQKIGTKKFQQEQASEKAIAKQVKESENLDRALKAASVELKKALLPLVKAITPFFQGMAKAVGTIGKALSGETGRMILKITGGAIGGIAVFRLIQGVKNMFGGGLTSVAGEMMGGDKPGTQKKGFLDKILGRGGKLGESASNPMYVYVVNQGGGAGGAGGEDGGEEGDFDSPDKTKGKFGRKKASFGKKLSRPGTMLKAAGRNLMKGGRASRFLGKGLSGLGSMASKAIDSPLGKVISGVAGKGGLGGIAKGVLGLGTKAVAPITSAVMTGKGLYDFFSDKKLRNTGIGGFFESLGGTGMNIIDNLTFGLTKWIGNKTGMSIPGMGTDDVASARAIFHDSGRDPDDSRFPVSTDNKQLINDILSNPKAYPEGIVEQARGVNIAELAKGGIVTGPTRALVGEAGSEAVIPLDKFYAKLDELITAVKAGGNVYLDATKVGTAMSVGTYKLQ